MRKTSKLIAIGEALIDFIPQESGKPIKQVGSFAPKVGGAPANVCGVFSKMGQQSQLITQLGMDPFADKILDEFQSNGIGCEYISRTDRANTSLAFVALQEDGNREFSFYRNPGADMLLEADCIQKEWFADADVLHFCSVSLGDFPMKDAHKRAIEYAREQGAIISFDPNLRPALWKDLEELRRTVLEFLPYADILKISDEELEFITGKKTIEEAREILWQGQVKLVIYTKGGNGAEAYTRTENAQSPSVAKNVIDTTGAGDAFIGAFLYQITRDQITSAGLDIISAADLKGYLDCANRYCGRSVARHGAIDSYPDQEEADTIF